MVETVVHTYTHLPKGRCVYVWMLETGEGNYSVVLGAGRSISDLKQLRSLMGTFAKLLEHRISR